MKLSALCAAPLKRTNARPGEVRFWHLADITAASEHVRYRE